MTKTDRLTRALFVALAVGLGWGIRGDFGGFEGAMFPGACLGLAFAYVAGQQSLFKRMPALGALTGIFIGMGGMMSYGILHGYAKADTLVNYSYGFLTLFMQGGAWGVFGCAIVGLVLEDKPPRWWQWISLAATVIVCGMLFRFLVVDTLGFHVNPPRGNTSVTFTGGAIALFVWLIVAKKPYGLRGALFGYLGFGIGMSFGRFLGNASYHLPWSVNHWNIMEVSAGFFGGLIFTYGMLGKKVAPPPEREGLPIRVGLSMCYVLFFIPVNHLLTRTSPVRKLAEWSQSFASYGLENADAMSQRVYMLLAIVALSGIVGIPIWLSIHTRKKTAFAAIPVLWLSLTMLLFQNLNALYFWYPRRPGAINMHFVFWVLFALMVVYVLARRQHAPAVEPDETMSRLPWVRWCSAALAVYIFIIALSAIVNGPKTMASANTRFPLWSWRDGPPSG